MIALAVDALSWLLLTGGGAFIIIGALGMVRLPDVYARMHAAGITDTLGAGLVISGLALQGGWSQTTIKLILIVIFLLYTSPTSTYALANAAYSRGLQPLLAPRKDDENAPPAESKGDEPS